MAAWLDWPSRDRATLTEGTLGSSAERASQKGPWMLAVVAARRLLVALLLSASIVSCTGSTDPVKPAAAQDVAVEVVPAAPQVAPGEVIAFAATVTGTANTAVSWNVQEASGGTVDATGHYTAPPSAGVFHVTATSSADPTKQAAATVTVSVPAPVVVTVSPATGAVDECRTLQLGATVTGSANTAVTWSVQEGATGGTVSPAGLYTAPNGSGTYHVVAKSVADPTKSSIATITVKDTILAVAVSPQTVTVPPGGTATFTATVTNTCGTFTSTAMVGPGGVVVAN
jgi:hypothetical protein